MNAMMIVKIIFAVGTIITGLLGLIKPAAVLGFTGLNINGPRGTSEIRAIFGGLLIGLGLAPFLVGDVGYMVLGISYLSIAIARGFSILFDKSYESSNLISLVIEIVFGLVLVL
jgi:hypothetical protein